MTTSKPSVLVLSLSDPTRDPRVYRQLRFLSGTCDLAFAGLAPPESSEITYFPITRGRGNRGVALGRLLAGAFGSLYWSDPTVVTAWAVLRDHQPDLIVSNDLSTLPLAVRLGARHGGRVLFDAHEYYPRRLDDRLFFRLFVQRYYDFLCRRYLPRVDGMTTVCGGIAREYQRVYGVESQVITNAPFFADLEPGPVRPERVQMVHHGGLNPSRKLVTMFSLLDHLPERFRLDLLLVNNHRKYFRKI